MDVLQPFLFLFFYPVRSDALLLSLIPVGPRRWIERRGLAGGLWERKSFGKCQETDCPSINPALASRTWSFLAASSISCCIPMASLSFRAFPKCCFSCSQPLSWPTISMPLSGYLRQSFVTCNTQPLLSQSPAGQKPVNPTLPLEDLHAVAGPKLGKSCPSEKSYLDSMFSEWKYVFRSSASSLEGVFYLAVEFDLNLQVNDLCPSDGKSNCLLRQSS